MGDRMEGERVARDWGCRNKGNGGEPRTSECPPGLGWMTWP